MKLINMYLVTIVELIAFVTIGFFLTENVISKGYESIGIPYIGNVGVVIFGVSMLLFCLFTLFRTHGLSVKSPLLKERIQSLSFWIVLGWSVFAVVSPFIRGEI